MAAVAFDQHNELDNKSDYSQTDHDDHDESDGEYMPSKREQYILAEMDRQALSEEFKQHVAQMQANDLNNMSLEWWAGREKARLRNKIEHKLTQQDWDEINAKHGECALELTPELDEKIKKVANKLTSKMLEDMAEYAATLPDVNYKLIKERVLNKIHPGNYTSTHQAIYEQHQTFAEHIDTDLLTDEIEAISL